MNLTVFGAGAWGTALAIHAAAKNPTRLWARDSSQIDRMRATRTNAAYLPGIALPDALTLDGDFDAALAHASEGLVVIATPTAVLDEMLHRIGTRARGVLWLCKGFEPHAGLLGHELARHAAPGARSEERRVGKEC